MKEINDSYDVIHANDTNPEYIIRPSLVGGYVLNLPVRNPEYRKPDSDPTNEDLTSID